MSIPQQVTSPQRQLGLLYYKDMSIRYFPLSPLQVKYICDEWQDEELIALALQEAAAKAASEYQQYLARAEETLARVRVGEKHAELKFQVPSDVDLEHCQAILAYGFMFPGSSLKCAGKNMIQMVTVRGNVRNKLLERFDHKKFAAAFRFLDCHGVIISPVGKHAENGRTLNLHENGPGVSPTGREIIVLCKQFLWSST